ncbi:MAG TPA: hypothetical protein VLM42_09690 [Bryobacteraceae bacterium]|nr:hypothetical protein [Bryobacteraceae bacterium]
MTRSKLGIALLVFAATAAAQTSTWELGHPDAKLLLGIDVKSIRESDAWRVFNDPTKAPAFALQDSVQAMQAMGMQILDQVNYIFVSSPANMTANAKTKPPFLLAIEGKFPLDALKPFMQSAPRRYRTADLYRTTKTDTTTLAVMDGLLLLGDEKSVLSALDRRGHALPPASKLLARAKALAATHDVWIIADESLSKFQPAKSDWNPLAAPFASQIQGIDFGLAVREGFRFELSLATESEAAATQMAQMLGTQIQTELATKADTPEVAEMAQKLKIDSLGNRMRVSLAETKEEFAALLQAAQAAEAARAQAAAAAPKTPPSAARPAKPATPGKITIYGLDGGPRVIETTH